MSEKVLPAIRLATAADAGLLAELGASTFYETFIADTTPDDMAAYLSASFSPALQAQEIAAADTTFFIAEIAGMAAGYAKLQSSAAPSCVSGAQPVELCRLYVASGLIGSGVGAALMQACIREAERTGSETMWLGVWEHNERAQRFYKRWGFEVVGEHIFQLGSDAQRDLLMQRKI